MFVPFLVVTHAWESLPLQESRDGVPLSTLTLAHEENLQALKIAKSNLLSTKKN